MPLVIQFKQNINNPNYIYAAFSITYEYEYSFNVQLKFLCAVGWNSGSRTNYIALQL